MITNRTISITASTVIDNAVIANHGAIIDVETNDISFYCTQVDKLACKTHREAVRADQAEFEDFAYGIQEEVKSAQYIYENE